MSVFSRKFLLDVKIKTQFTNLCDSLSLKKDAWACFFIRFEMDFLDNGRCWGAGTNTEAALKYLEKQRSKIVKEEYAIKMSQEFVDKIDMTCAFHNITRVMLVEFALTNACDRIKLDTKLHGKRSDLLPLYLLEQSVSNRLMRDQRMALVKESLIIGKMK